MDANSLYREGVLAIRDQQDLRRGRELLIQSLRLDPHNDMAWLWLTLTVQDHAKRLEFVERALSINPANESAQQLKARLIAQSPPEAVAPAHTPPATAPPSADAVPPAPPPPSQPEPAPQTAIRPLGPRTLETPLTEIEQDRIAQLMQKAEIYAESGEAEDAISEWVKVLQIRVDHEEALRNAAGHLWRLGYRDDARELVQRALDAGTKVPSVYMTAIDMAERVDDYGAADDLRQRIATLPDVDDQLLITVADYYVERHHRPDQALIFLERALATHPESQPLLVKIGDMLQEQERPEDALKFYDRAARLSTRSKAGREADKKLAGYVPVLTDRERGSVGLAVRETIGIGALYLLMALQDAGLTFNMGTRHWAGVALSLIGGYLLVTATSSPQQQPIAAWLGGTVPPEPVEEGSASATPAIPGRAIQEPTHLPGIPDDARVLIGFAGAVVLALAFVLVFYHALDLVTTNPPPYLP